MRTGITVVVSRKDHKRQLAIAADRNSPQKHVWRDRIVLLTAAGHGTADIMPQAGVAKTAVWRWQERFMAEGVDVLLRDKTRRPRIAPLDPTIADAILDRIVHRAHRIELKGDSLRKRHAVPTTENLTSPKEK